MAAEKLKGTMKSFNEPDGFGIISSVDGAKDYLVHRSDIKADGYGQVSEGQRVEFTAGTRNDGKPIALDVTIIGGSQGADNGKAPQNVSK